ncbi:hypothetical protein DPMN_122849 [Dreissena polymorpha]|uniref:Uncharacterized protein n=1 Tax=Dreissena polymorpha TaxID=45954 RepID=A0A9D4JQY3_DREPO|nr:hypothetical protein DPMN_122849 [Dreissena polymorpha]
MDFYKITVELSSCINRIVDNYTKRSIVCKQTGKLDSEYLAQCRLCMQEKGEALIWTLGNTGVDRQ